MQFTDAWKLEKYIINSNFQTRIPISFCLALILHNLAMNVACQWAAIANRNNVNFHQPGHTYLPEVWSSAPASWSSTRPKMKFWTQGMVSPYAVFTKTKCLLEVSLLRFSHKGIEKGTLANVPKIFLLSAKIIWPAVNSNAILALAFILRVLWEINTYFLVLLFLRVCTTGSLKLSVSKVLF